MKFEKRKAGWYVAKKGSYHYHVVNVGIRSYPQWRVARNRFGSYPTYDERANWQYVPTKRFGETIIQIWLEEDGWYEADNNRRGNVRSLLLTEEMRVTA